MPRLAANLTMLWTELDPYDRFRAAAAAGFREVEMLFPHELDPTRLEVLLSQLGLQMVLFDPAAGDWAAGERGLMCLPGREAEFISTVQAALGLAHQLGTTKINILAGVAPTSVPVEVTMRTAMENLRRAADLAGESSIDVLVENINKTDVPGYLINTAEKAAEIVATLGVPNVRLQLDQYHATMAGEDAVDFLHHHFSQISHVQIADVPGRHQPGTGQAPIARFLDELGRGGYAGWVGLEYRPLGSTEESLVWAHPYLKSSIDPGSGPAYDLA
jgi:hydroxypyruvate isomerase